MTAYRHGPKLTVGLVGGIGAGKSTAAGLLAARGGAVVNADALGHQALDDPAVRQQVLGRWGDRTTLVRPDGTFDRRALAAVVFADPAERAALEGIVFPWITTRAVEQIGRAQADPGVRFVVVDAAVMLEAGWGGLCDRVVYVDAPADQRRARVAARSGWTAADLAAREAAQWPAERKLRQSDAVLTNDGTPAELAARVDELLTAWNIA